MGLLRRVPWCPIVAALVFALGASGAAWRLESAPDVFTDEIVYARAGVRVAGECALVSDRGEPIYVHPPLYFLVEAAFFRLAGTSGAPLYAAGDVFSLVYHARTLNALLAAATATLLYLLGRRLRNNALGLLLAAIFLLDPFGLRINRRAMLETMAGLLALAGMALFLARATVPQRSSLPWAVAAGVLLGAAVLTKEITFISVPALLAFGAREARRGGAGQVTGRQRTSQLLPALLAAAVAIVTYSVYPLWILVAADWERFAEVKWLSLQRLVGLVQITGWNRPGLSLVDFLLPRLADYGSSYALLGLGAAATAWLLWRGRDSADSRLLAIWGLVLYAFFGFVALFGSGNDQFFYFLLVPAVVLTGYAALTVWDRCRPGLRGWVWLVAAGEVLVLLLAYNAVQWWSAYGAGLDNAYYRIRDYVQQQLPQADPLNATGDALKFQYFFPDRLISAAATPEEARALGVSYFALAPKDVGARYGRMTPAMAKWIVDHGQLLTSAEGDSYGTIYIYQVGADVPAGGSVPAAADLEAAGPRQRRFAPATGGQVGDLLIMLSVWAAILGTLAGILWIWHSLLPERAVAGRTGP